MFSSSFYRTVVVIVVAFIAVGGFLYIRSTSSEFGSSQDVDRESTPHFEDTTPPANMLTVTAKLIGFETAPKVIVDFVHDILEADVQQGRIGPDSHIDSVELIRVREVTWNTSCLTFVNAYPDLCVDGVYPGYEFAVLIDGDDEFQVWRTTTDGVHQDIGGGYSESEINSELGTW